MKYKFGDREWNAEVLASQTDELYDNYEYCRYWIDQIQKARSNAYSKMSVYSCLQEQFEDVLKEEFAAIGVEIIPE